MMRQICRFFGVTPMQRVFRELRRRGVDTRGLSVLEFFGGTGDFHTMDYARQVGQLDAWEIQAKHEPLLRRNLPGATIRIGDSFALLKQCREKYDLVVVDNPMGVFGGDRYCEHFELYPDVLRLLKDQGILIMNFFPEAPEAARKKWRRLFEPAQLERRKAFYKTDSPEHVSQEAAIQVYRAMAAQAGYELEWHFLEKRTYSFIHEWFLGVRGFAFYLVMKARGA